MTFAIQGSIPRYTERPLWGKDWGKKPHGFQPISADLDLAKLA